MMADHDLGQLAEFKRLIADWSPNGWGLEELEVLKSVADMATLQHLIDQAIAMKTEGNNEFCLYFWADGSDTPWSAHIGNPSRWVAMLEADSEFTGRGDTSIKAVENLIKIMRTNRE